MSSDRNSPPLPSPGAAGRRRSSIAGQFVDLFGSRSSNAGANPPANPAGPITTAAAQAQQRRLSLTTVGLSGTPNQTSPFGSLRSRGDSFSSSNSGTVEESPFEEGDGPVPTSPFVRRMSFGARAMQNMRTPTTGNGTANGRSSISKAKTPPAANHSRGLSCSYRNNICYHALSEGYADMCLLYRSRLRLRRKSAHEG
jgi:hypothetical protein